MATTPTTGDIPSNAAVDLKFNSEQFDRVMNSDDLTYTDRFGKKRITMKGVQELANGFQDTFTNLLGSPDGFKLIGGVKSFDTLRSTPVRTEGQRIFLKSYYENSNTGGGIFIGHLGTKLDDYGMVAQGVGFYWERIQITQSPSPEMFGAVGDGIADDSDAIQRALDSGYSIKAQIGSRHYVTKAINLKSGASFDGNNQLITFNNGTSAYMFGVSGISDVSIKNINIAASVTSSSTLSTFMIKVTASSNIFINNVKARDIGVVFTEATTNTYTNIIADVNNAGFNCCRNITLDGFDVDCTNNKTGGPIQLRYCVDWRVANGMVRNAYHGVMWWGGDSNSGKDGNVGNDRKCKNGIITNVQAKNISMGGIWGSMGEGIIVTDNIVNICGDVGIDLEGCTASLVSNNYVRNCKNGGLTTFFYSLDVQFTGNVVKQPSGYHCFKIYNTAQNKNNTGVSVSGNTFIGEGIYAACSFSSGPVRDFHFVNNKLTNCVIDFSANNSQIIKVSDNTLVFDFAGTADFSALSVQTGTGTEITDVSNNIIISIATQTVPAIPFTFKHADFNASGTVDLRGNTVRGFPGAVMSAINNSTNGQSLYILCKDNKLYSGNYTKTLGAGAVGQINIVDAGNYNVINYATLPMTLVS